MYQNYTEKILRCRKDAQINYVYVYVLSWFGRVRLSATPWTAAYQAPLSMGFSRQEYWSGVPFPPPGDLLDPGIEPESPVSLALSGRFSTTETYGKPPVEVLWSQKSEWKETVMIRNTQKIFWLYFSLVTLSEARLKSPCIEIKSFSGHFCLGRCLEWGMRCFLWELRYGDLRVSVSNADNSQPPVLPRGKFWVTSFCQVGVEDDFEMCESWVLKLQNDKKKKNGEILKGGRHTAINSKTLKLSHGGEALLNKESFGSIWVHCIFYIL